MSNQPDERGLSVDAIVDVAARISEQDGFDSISMRRIADEFDVTAMALYGYVSTKHHLLELVADRYMAELDLAEQVEDWGERLLRLFRSFYELLVDRPVLAHVLTQQTVDSPAAYRMAEVVLGILREEGFDTATAVETVQMLASFTVGTALSSRPRVTTDWEDRVRRLRDAGTYPNLSAAAADYVRWSPTIFERGLLHLLNATRAVHAGGSVSPAASDALAAEVDGAAGLRLTAMAMQLDRLTDREREIVLTSVHAWDARQTRLAAGREPQMQDGLGDHRRRIGVVLEAIAGVYRGDPSRPLVLTAGVVEHPHWQLPGSSIAPHDLVQLEALGLVHTRANGEDGVAVIPTQRGWLTVEHPAEALELEAAGAPSARAARLVDLARTIRARKIADEPGVVTSLVIQNLT